MPDDDKSNLFSRIGQVEQQIAGLASTVEGLAESVQQSNRQIARLADDTRATLERRTQTQWSPIIGAATLIVLILGSFFGYITKANKDVIGEVSRVVTSIAGDFHDHKEGWGHLPIGQKVEEHSTQIAELDDRLQREMRLLNAEIKATIIAEEAGLQKEMELIKENNQLRSEGLNNIQVQQIKELQRVVFGDDAQWDRVIQEIREIAGD